MQNLPLYIPVVFISTLIFTLFFFFKATHSSKYSILIISGWLVLQGIVGYLGFYTKEDAVPPRFLFLILPPLIAIGILFGTGNGRRWLYRMDIRMLTILHIIRIPVELVLFWLFIYNQIPVLMTFEGRNFDIISGLTAPLIYYFGFIKESLNRKLILAWNFICLALLVNIVAIAILSAPLPFQKLVFDQPNRALLYFPYIWLPSILVPIVLFSHLVTIRKLYKEKYKRIPLLVN